MQSVTSRLGSAGRSEFDIIPIAHFERATIMLTVGVL